MPVFALFWGAFCRGRIQCAPMGMGELCKCLELGLWGIFRIMGIYIGAFVGANTGIRPYAPENIQGETL